MRLEVSRYNIRGIFVLTAPLGDHGATGQSMAGLGDTAPGGRDLALKLTANNREDGGWVG